MKGLTIAWLVVLALLVTALPALALNEASCSALGQIGSNMSGPSGTAIGGVVSQNCTNSSPAAGPTVVATAEPLGGLAIGLGLLGARALRRRR